MKTWLRKVKTRGRKVKTRAGVSPGVGLRRRLGAEHLVDLLANFFVARQLGRLLRTHPRDERHLLLIDSGFGRLGTEIEKGTFGFPLSFPAIPHFRMYSSVTP